MYRKAALLLLAVVCVAPYLAFANEDDADLLDTPLFAMTEDTAVQPQRSLLATTTTTGYYGGYAGGYYYGGYQPTVPPVTPVTPCKEKAYEIYFVATTGVIKSTITGKFRWGLYRDRVLIPKLKSVSRPYGPWKFPVTNYSRCIVQKSRPFAVKTKVKLNFYARVVCNLTDIKCSLRPGLRNSLRNAAKIKDQAFVVAV